VFLSPDIATCDDCLAELFDPRDRRYRYPFLNCTQCGPRLTIIAGAPYDRERTTMARFAMCAECRAEFDDPTNRRFHAQPTCCPRCGPKLRLEGAAGECIDTGDPLKAFAQALVEGKIGALKGLGGYHLACDAMSEAAVVELRRRKHRDEKPLAVMVADLAAAERLCEIDALESALLTSPRRPIVLLRRRADGVAPSVAPGNPSLGVMLPYTPLHHLLLRAVNGRPLVMTSGNRSDEPIAYQDDDAIERLCGIADLFLGHDRPIRVRCDDSVTRIVAGRQSLVRRSRGFAPEPIMLPIACPRPILAVGGQLKGTFALGRDKAAFVSHHLGDLDHWPAYAAFRRDIALFEELFETRPELIVHDLHPDYASTRYTLERAAIERLPTIAVQHHHAHIGSCLAEHQLEGPVIGVALDGTGYGSDGAIWGGEFLIADLHGFRRAAHLRYVGLPGGDQAIREPWRSAAAQLIDAGEGTQLLEANVEAAQLHVVEQMLARGVNCPQTSSAGRLFDAVSAIAGLRTRVSYEGQAAMELEWLAGAAHESGGYPFELVQAAVGDSSPSFVVDTRLLIRAVAADVRRRAAQAQIARRFHTTLVEIIVAACESIRQSTRLSAVALSGGVFMNALLAAEATGRLMAAGFEVYNHRRFPPNDGGLALGQLAIAAASAAARKYDLQL
jgi:hydrogenase maturation protein HypF